MSARPKTVVPPEVRERFSVGIAVGVAAPPATVPEVARYQVGDAAGTSDKECASVADFAAGRMAEPVWKKACNVVG